jgi:hypothetical protein
LFQHDHLHSLRSLAQLLQFSAAPTTQSQQKLVQSFTSSLQFLQFSHSSIIPFQHTGGFDQSVRHMSHKSAGQVSHVSFLSYLLFGQDFISLQSFEQILSFAQFKCDQKSHSSFHSLIPFQQFGVVEIIFVHFSLQLCSLFGVQLFVQSSHFSSHSVLLFQHTVFVFLHSKEHSQSYQLFIPLSHSSLPSLIPFQHVREQIIHKSTGHVKHVSH